MTDLSEEKKRLIDEAVTELLREESEKAGEAEDIAESLEEVAKLPGIYYAALIEAG